tara:strand:+ start:398 stop:973 length:576 start_codon:yes stop_codon:yes gene_type:complete
MSLYFVGDINILADKRLSSIDVRVYFALVSFMNKADGKCYPRYATIQKRTGLSRRSIQRSVKHLAKLKLISMKRLSSSNLYLLTRQKILQETIQKRVRRLVGSSDEPNSRLLVKLPYLTKNRFNNRNNYNRSSSYTPVAKHSIEYEGETYIECGREGHYVEYQNKRGDRIKRHTFKKDEPIKKFSAILRVA